MCCWTRGDDNDLLFTSEFGQDGMKLLYPTAKCILGTRLVDLPLHPFWQAVLGNGPFSQRIFFVISTPSLKIR